MNQDGTEKKSTELVGVYELLNVAGPKDLFDRYMEEDQKIVTSGIEDYESKRHITTQIKDLLEGIDREKLTLTEEKEISLILWMWYHHAISYAIWGYKDKKKALLYAKKALKYQPKKHPNRITKLLYLLVRGNLRKAEEWIGEVGEEERKTAEMLIRMYKNGEFFS